MIIQSLESGTESTARKETGGELETQAHAEAQRKHISDCFKPLSLKECTNGAIQQIRAFLTTYLMPLMVTYSLCDSIRTATRVAKSANWLYSESGCLSPHGRPGL